MRLRTLGDFGLYRAGGERLLGAGKPLALLAYLNALPGHSASRDHLLHTLWADLDEKSGRHALRQTVWYLRQQLGDGALAVRTGRVSLSAPIDADVGEFLALVEAGRLEDAVAAYDGDFLETFVVPGGLGFEQWADAERHRLRLLFRRALEAFARSDLARGRHRQARALATRLQQADPLDEASWRLLIETALAAADRVSALADAARLSDLLAAERREPEPATTSVLQRLEDEPLHGEPPPTPSMVADLVGRERQLSTLVSAFREVARGRGRTVEVVAPAGLGKTRLLRDFARHSSASGRDAVYVRALPADRELAWSYAGEVVRHVTKLPGAVGVSPAVAATLSSLDPGVASRWPGVTAPSPAGGERVRHRVAAVAELLRTVADERPIALLLDDLHWADARSRELLGRVSARLSDAPVLIVGAFREGIPVGLGAPSDPITLDPITVEQTATLVASLGAWSEEKLVPDFAARLHATAHGSPMLVLETLKLAVDSGCLTLARGKWRCADRARLDSLLEAGAAPPGGSVNSIRPPAGCCCYSPSPRPRWWQTSSPPRSARTGPASASASTSWSSAGW
ncbi:MAG: AAA family ATPase [Gemmatimonadales bacterium]